MTPRVPRLARTAPFLLAFLVFLAAATAGSAPGLPVHVEVEALAAPLRSSPAMTVLPAEASGRPPEVRFTLWSGASAKVTYQLVTTSYACGPPDAGGTPPPPGAPAWAAVSLAPATPSAAQRTAPATPFWRAVAHRTATPASPVEGAILAEGAPPPQDKGAGSVRPAGWAPACGFGAARLVTWEGPAATVVLAGGEGRQPFAVELPRVDGPTGPQVERVFLRVATPGAQPVLLAPGERYDPPEGNASLAPAAAGSASLGLAAAGLASADAQGQQRPSHRWRDWSLPVPLPLLGLFTRLQRSRLLDHPTRRQLHETVEANPGIRFADLRALAGLPTGVLTHHLRVLEAHGLLHSVRLGRQRHLYTEPPAAPGPPGLTDPQRRVLGLLAAGVRSQAAIARRLAVTQQTVSYHILRLRAQGAFPDGPPTRRDPRQMRETG